MNAHTPSSPAASRAAAAAVLALSLAAAAAPPPAGAAPYPMHQCRFAGEERPAPLANVYGSTPETSLRDSCLRGGWLTLSSRPGGLPAEQLNTLWMGLPDAAAHLRIRRLRLRFNSGPVEDARAEHRVQLHAAGKLLYDERGRPDYAVTELDRELPGETRDVSLSSFCAGTADCRFRWGDELNVFAATFTLDEPALPEVAAAGGSLLAGGARSGVERLGWEAADGDSGVREVRARLGGAPAGVRTAACEYVRVQPCDARVGGSFAVDTAAVADGVHPVRLEAVDAAGNVRVREIGTVAVDNVPGGGGGGGGGGGAGGPAGPAGPAGPMGPSGAPNGAGATATAVLRARWSGTSRTVKRVRYGRRALVTGRLLRPDGAPIGGAAVGVMTRVATPGARLRPAGHVTTDETGAFAFLAPAGPSRTVRFGYGALLGDVEFARTADVELRVIAGVTLRPSRRRVRNGQAVRFRGRVRGLPRGTRKTVELQARTRGRWMTFATALARGRGTFARRYRFTRTSRPRTYAFRARARREAGFPYETGASKVTRVRVGR